MRRINKFASKIIYRSIKNKEIGGIRVRGYKKILGFTISLLLIFKVNALAVENIPENIKLVGEADGIIFIPGEEPFLNKLDMLPGDSVKRELVIQNNYDKPYELYLKAERVTPKEQFDLLDKLELKIIYKDKIIYEGPASGEDGLGNNISLGSYNPGDESSLVAIVKLDGATTGNEYKNKLVQVDWIFTAVNKENPSSDNQQQVQTFMKIKTGDAGIAGTVLVLLVSGILAVMIKKNKKDKRGEYR